MTRLIERWAAKRGIPCERRPVAPLRDNVLLRYAVPKPAFTLLLEVHQDTVPVDGMTIDPFAGEIRDGRLYGRGACDVKGGMASMLAVMDRLHREKPATGGNVVLACTVDEEHTFIGVQQLMKEGLKADFAVCAEPTNLRIVDAHKGVARWRITTAGKACHSSAPEGGVNAIYRMARLLGAVEDYAEHLRRSPSDHRLGSPTISVGRIGGGTGVNIVPDRCWIDIDRRLLPGELPEEASRSLERFLSSHPAVDFPFQSEPLVLACPSLRPLETGRGKELTQRLGEAIDRFAGPHRVEAVPYGTDASSIAEAGIPAVVFGPGDIAQAHTADEWIELKQVEQAAEILFSMATRP
jgi:acetylornithine deacetylase